MNQSLRLTPVHDLSALLNESNLAAVGIGHNGMIYLVVSSPGKDHQYRVVELSDSGPVIDFTVKNEPLDIHYIQPLLNDILLVCGRSEYRGADDFDKNGRIYSRSGKFKREMLLGDGIESVQTTSEGTIWTSFFDEGIFGNYGWNEPVGVSGLVAWDSSGNKIYEFHPSGKLESIDDCYALNVESKNNTWCYYYSSFCLVHLYSCNIKAYWEIPIKGSLAFAVFGGHALFQGGYKEHDSYYLLSLFPDGKAEIKGKFNVVDKDGEGLVSDFVVARADKIFIISKGKLYRIDLKELL